MQALPYATQLLGRLGAEVVKVEAPGTGDLGRTRLARHDRPRRARRRRHLPAQQPVQALHRHRPEAAGRARPRAAAGAALRRRGRELPRRRHRAPRPGLRGRGRRAPRRRLPLHLGLRPRGAGGHPGLPLRRLARAGLHRRGDERRLRVQAPRGATADRLAHGRAGRHRHRAVRRHRHPGRPAPARPHRAGPARRRRHARRPGGRARRRAELLVHGHAHGHAVARDPARLPGRRRLVHAAGAPAAPVARPGPRHRPAGVGRRRALRHAPGLARPPRVRHPARPGVLGAAP